MIGQTYYKVTDLEKHHKMCMFLTHLFKFLCTLNSMSQSLRSPALVISSNWYKTLI